MNSGKTILSSVGFSLVMSIFALLMFAEYTWLILGGDDSLRRVIVLCLWGIISIGWITAFIIRFQARKKRRGSKVTEILMLLLVVFSLNLLSCQEDPTSSTPPPPTDNQSTEPSWMTYSPYKWSHDGDPYYSVYSNVYSDGAGYDLKQEVGVFVDAKFIQVLDLFNFTDMSDLRYPPGYNKIDIYIIHNREENLAAAYWGSVFMTIRTDNLNHSRYDYLFRHELTHVFQFLIEDKVNLSTEIWFSEGIAIYAGGGLGGITDLQDLEQWIAKNSGDPNQGNPICIEVWDDFPPGADITGYYYTVFDLTMRYFLDPKGLGKSTEDVLGLFYDLRANIAFPAAFQSHFGLDLDTLENEYYDRMRAYLANVN